MGRTLPSARMLIAMETDSIMRHYAKRLEDRKDRNRLNNILNLSKRHSHSVSEAVRLFPLEGILMAILLERQKEIDSLLERFQGAGTQMQLVEESSESSNAQ